MKWPKHTPIMTLDTHEIGLYMGEKEFYEDTAITAGQPYAEPAYLVINGESVNYSYDKFRLATFWEFMFENQNGFGKTKWIQFWLIVGLSLLFFGGGIFIAGLISKIICFSFGLGIPFLLSYMTWRNFKVKTI